MVGEAPGVSEDVRGRPFVGPAGKLLDVIIVDGFRTRPKTRWVLTNLVACYPKKAKKEGTGEPSKEAIIACQDRLVEFCEIAKPRILLNIGKLAKGWTGKLLANYSFGGIYTIVHPAAIRRMEAVKQPLAIKRCIATLQEIAWELDRL